MEAAFLVAGSRRAAGGSRKNERRNMARFGPVLGRAGRHLLQLPRPRLSPR